MLLVIFLSIWLLLYLLPPIAWLSCVLSILAICAIKYRKRKITYIIASIIILFLFLYFLKTSLQVKPMVKGIGLVIESKENYYIVNHLGRNYYIYSKGHGLDIGDILLIEGKTNELVSNTIESQFDFYGYLNNKGITHEVTLLNRKILFSNPIRIHAYQSYLANKLNDNAASLMNAILFNNRDDRAIIKNFSSLHIVRLISNSGLYLHLFLGLLNKLLQKKISKKKSDIISLTILSFYFIFTFPRLTVIKILVFSVFKWVNRYKLNKKFSYVQIISIVGIMFLLIDPFLAKQDSFILSFGFLLVFYLVSPGLKNINRIKKWVFTLLIACIFFIPFEIRYYHSFAPLSYILTPILFPIFALFSIVSLLCFYGLPLFPLVNILANPIEGLSELLVKHPLEIYAGNITSFSLVIYVVISIILIYFIVCQFKMMIKATSSTLFLFLLIHFLPLDNLTSEEITFINVGQGDATLIRKGQRAYLIDTGGLRYLDVAKISLVPLFKQKKIYSLEYVFVTHHDYDHYGAYDSLKNIFPIKHYVDSYVPFPINEHGLTFTNYNNHIDSYSDENDRSLVIGFTLMNLSFLVMGDAPNNVENNIIQEYPKLRCDILKVGHHGSNTSSSDNFIKHVKPKKAIISCGKNNRYGHPHQQTLNTLKKYDVEIYRTDEMGTITFKKFYYLPFIFN